MLQGGIGRIAKELIGRHGCRAAVTRGLMEDKAILSGLRPRPGRRPACVRRLDGQKIEFPALGRRFADPIIHCPLLH
jgi:hypothetical protein